LYLPRSVLFFSPQSRHSLLNKRLVHRHALGDLDEVVASFKVEFALLVAFVGVAWKMKGMEMSDGNHK
jgi:hypothetical protein